MDAASTWSEGALQDVESFNDFQMVIVVTDEIETGQDWIEQIETTGDSRPQLHLITSAQVGPFLQPYLHSGQVEGMIPGLVGSSTYNTDDPAIAGDTGYLVPMRYGVLLVVAFIVLSMLFQFVLAPLASRRRKKS
jgi:hypothetical protein